MSLSESKTTTSENAGDVIMESSSLIALVSFGSGGIVIEEIAIEDSGISRDRRVERFKCWGNAGKTSAQELVKPELSLTMLGYIVWRYTQRFQSVCANIQKE